MRFYKQWKLTPPRKGDTRPRCAWRVRRGTAEVPCGRLARLWRFCDRNTNQVLVEEHLCGWHATDMTSRHNCTAKDLTSVSRRRRGDSTVDSRAAVAAKSH
jgi:hypothetical protein